MSEPEIKPWVQRLDVKPGDILVVRYHVPDAVPRDAVKPILAQSQETLRKTLDLVGLTDDKVPLLMLTHEWDIAVLHPLEILAKMDAAKEAEDRANDS